MPLDETVTDDTFSGIANWFQRCFLEHLSNPLSAANSRNIAFSDRIAAQTKIQLQIGNVNTEVSFKDLMDFDPGELSKLFSVNPENGDIIWNANPVSGNLARFKEVMQNPANMPILIAAAAKASDNPKSVYSDIHSAYELASDLKATQDEARMQMRASSDFTPAYAVDDETKSDTKPKSLAATIQDDVLITFHTGFMRDIEEGLVKELMQPKLTLENEATPEAATTPSVSRPKSYAALLFSSGAKMTPNPNPKQSSKFLAAVGRELVEKYVTAIANLFAVNPELVFELRDEGCFRIRFGALELLKEKIAAIKSSGVIDATPLDKHLNDVLEARIEIDSKIKEYMLTENMQADVPKAIGMIFFNLKKPDQLPDKIRSWTTGAPLAPEPLEPPRPVGRRGSLAAVVAPSAHRARPGIGRPGS